MTNSLSIATAAADVAQVRELFVEYAQSLGYSLCFQGFNHELAALPGDYAAPRGILLLARDGERALGCVAVRPLGLERAGSDDTIAELKRLYVRPEARGRGLGARLTDAALAFARRAGYRAIRLDTLPAMTAAVHMYEALGFREIPAYYANPIPGTRYLELVLDPVRSGTHDAAAGTVDARADGSP